MENMDPTIPADQAVPETRNAVDLERLKADTGLSLREIANAVGMKESRNIYKWAYAEGGTRPSYDTIIRLMEIGASPEAVFGRPWPGLDRQPQSVSELAGSEEFKAGVREALAEIFNMKGNPPG